MTGSRGVVLSAVIAAAALTGCKGTESAARPPAYGFADQAAAIDNGAAIAQPQVPPPPQTVQTSIPAGTYVIEFRARTGPDIIGHTYVVYGVQSEDGTIAEATQVGLYPKDVAGFALGVFGTQSRTEPVGYDISIRPSVVYRRALTEEEYARLTAAVEAARANPPTWSWTGYNCNSFVADLAREVGMKTPPGATLLAPGLFVAELRALNV